MIDFKLLPVVSVDDLEDNLKERYPHVADKFEFLATVMFGDSYYNDSYKSYCFRNDESFKGYPWQDEAHCEVLTCLNEMLEESFSEYEYVIVDVSW